MTMRKNTAHTRVTVTKPRALPPPPPPPSSPFLLPLLLPLLLLLALSAVTAQDLFPSVSSTISSSPSPFICPWKDPPSCQKVRDADVCCNTTDRCSGQPVSQICPITCGLCEERPEPCPGMGCRNAGDLDLNTCVCECHGHMGGPVCDDCIEEDDEWCYRFKPRSMCGVYMGINPLLCPRYCGICPPGTCGNKQCSNLGRLNTTTCECECQGLFTGPNCELCPTDDYVACEFFQAENCTQEPHLFSEMQTNCPRLCGICP